MESAVPMLLFLAGLFGLVMLVLVMGIQSREEERAQEEAKRLEARLSGDADSTFLAKVDGEDRKERRRKRAPSLVEVLECHLKRERGVAASFAEGPSARGLFPDTPSRADSAIARLERHLARETHRVTGFVDDPSTASLLRAERGEPATGSAVREEGASR